MTWDEFDDFAPRSAEGFAARLVTAGIMSPDEAEEYARCQLAEQLPDGIATPLHLLLTAREVPTGHHAGHAGQVVGHVWLRVGPASPPATETEAYLFDIELVESARGHGLGTATMLAAENRARDLGARSMRLTVFDRDAEATRMYKRLGYGPAAAESADIRARLMAKDL